MFNTGRKILLVESDPVLRDIIALALQRLNTQNDEYQVIAADEPGDVMQFLGKDRPQLLILDLYLPQMNGLDLIAQLKQQGLLGRIPIMVISAFGYREIVEQAVRAGASAFLVKPIDVDEFVNRARIVIEQAWGLSARSAES